LLVGTVTAATATATDAVRREWPLLDGWRTAMDQTNRAKFTGFEQLSFDDSAWRTVEVPHNWESYEGVRRLVHGNLHGYAWYRRSFDVPASEAGRRVFLFFEGVGSYATVWVNGQLAGSHAGGRTTFTLDVTDLVRVGATNTLAVRADHPAGITDLPWVCGGCSTQPGFSEGSQPFGIFRPVTLITTNAVRVVPFGIHVWNDADTSAATAKVHVRAELHNYAAPGPLTLTHEIFSPSGAPLAVARRDVTLPAGESTFVADFNLAQPTLWSPTTPALHRVVTTLARDGRVLDRVETTFGIRTAHWPAPDAPLPAPFRLNGEPVFLNGTCEYEHNLGASHAFTPEQIAARAAQVRAAGFNAFRDAHQPHNLRYQAEWDRTGILWWTQFASQIWFDTPEFRANFKRLLRDWVRERRNSPSLILWGLANESKLPTDFARECVAIIRELDPTSPSQRLVVTCNGGTGTDWNVPQNWTGTYGGDPATYADDLRRQRLVGEYGAWRSLGLHSEGGFIADGIRSESRHDALLALKIRLAESVRGEVPGHFHWLLVTHENPGRTIGSRGQQGSDGWAPLDRLGPANNKGNFTLWGEPTDAFFLFRASYAPPSDPMVHIVSHTWPDRWDGPGVKSGLEVWSNCEEVELFNDVGARSLGVRRRAGPGVPLRWDNVEITTDTLYAEGRIGGRTVARDLVRLRNLPPAPNRDAWRGAVSVSLAGEPGWNYLYRVNAGGPVFTDSHGQRWLADQDLRAGAPWGSRSWAARYADLPPRFGSQRESFDPIRGTADETLFQTYRYGREQLRFEFPVPDGDYRVELFFAEPWYGRGGGDAAGWRLFDVALNGQTVLRDVDLWRESGYSTAVKKVLPARAEGGRLVVSFPRVAAAQAVLSGLAIATRDASLKPITENSAAPAAETPALKSTASAEQSSTQELPASAAKHERGALTWRVTLGLGGTHDFAVRFANPSVATIDIEFRINATDGSVVELRAFRLPPTGAASAEIRASVGMNAGDYTVTVAPAAAPLVLESLRVN
jgi:hypothetical protein